MEDHCTRKRVVIWKKIWPLKECIFTLLQESSFVLGSLCGHSFALWLVRGNSIIQHCKTKHCVDVCIFHIVFPDFVKQTFSKHPIVEIFLFFNACHRYRIIKVILFYIYGACTIAYARTYTMYMYSHVQSSFLVTILFVCEGLSMWN